MQVFFKFVDSFTASCRSQTVAWDPKVGPHTLRPQTRQEELGMEVLGHLVADLCEMAIK